MSALPAAAGGDVNNDAISPAGRARLLEMSYSRIPINVFVVPTLAFALTWFYSQKNDATGMAIWACVHLVFALFLRQLHGVYMRDLATMGDTAILAKWLPLTKKLAIVYGLLLSAPAFITLGKAPFEFGILLLLCVSALTAANATHQTPELGIFWRLFLTGWNLIVVMVYWIFPDHWHFILPMALVFSASMFRQARTANKFFVKQIVLEERSIQLAEQYKAAKDQAEEALAAKNQFLATASHDLRQPVHAMGMLIEAIVHRNEQATLGPLLGDLKSSVHSVNLMFNSLLDLSKIESGIMTSQSSPVALAGMLRDVETLFREEAKRRGLQLRFRHCQPQAMVHADASLLRQALVNLVQNALRYTQTGGVLVGVRQRAGAWQIEVWDTGVGVSLQEREHIYTPFYRNENAWLIDSAGHGLGLAVVARCAKLMGATYGLTSRLGHGSRFWLQLPAATQADDQSPGLDTAPHIPSIATLRPLAGTCLVVEDDPQVSAAWMALFQAWHVDARFVTCANEAFAALDAGFAPRAILCDQRLRSGESGFEILRSLLERCPKASGAMVSGEFNSPELVRAESDGYLVLRKPLEVNDLHDVLARWFNA
jgi:signal transduction histidine kinase